MKGAILKNLLGVTQRMLINNQEKVDFLLDLLAKISAYALTKDDKILGQIISSGVEEYKEKFKKKTEDLILEAKSVSEEMKRE